MVYRNDMKDSEQGMSNWVAALVVTIVVLVGAGATYAAYMWQQATITDLHNQVSTLQSQVNKSCPSETTQPTMMQTCPSYSYKSAKGVEAIIYTPGESDTLSSPVGIVGKVPGNWSFEAQFPVKLLDSKGNVVAQAPATVLGTWQTTTLEPFSVQLTYSSHPTGTGTLVLQKDNPSGLPSNDDSISISVHF